MMPCRRSDLEQRCRQRGYTLAEVMPCVVAQDGDNWVVDVDSEFYPKRPKVGFEPQPDLARTDAPSFLIKVKNFAAATVQHVAAGMPICDDSEIMRRHDICLQCEHFKDNACSLCGCPLSRVAGYVSKLSWADQECPVGKWGKAEPKSHIDP